jgi:hypothetical protein
MGPSGTALRQASDVLDDLSGLPVLAADLTFVNVNGGRALAHMAN